VTGTVAAVHQGEPDHEARRSPLTLLPYALGQASRLRQGLGRITGNCVIISSAAGTSAFVAVMHLQAGSIRVSVGQEVAVGEHIANCGNSGNSTQPHVHLQAMDRLDPWTAQALPLRISRYYEKPRRSQRFLLRENTIPDEGSTVEAAREPLGPVTSAPMVSPVANTLHKSGSAT
jgi:murein DD-endopeptidase MepM/ murein hydrolase activator NlpD